ncbi:MAG: MbnP family copper-binding protein, partial [Myxococcota bacterium]|nr:MbnP family copper-binding protein [Myxococcota bacterium]
MLFLVGLLAAACGEDQGSGPTGSDADSGDVNGAGQDSAISDLDSAPSDAGLQEGGPPTSSTITLKFSVVAWEKPFTCNAPLSGLGNSGGVLEASDMRFYIHDVALHSSTTGEEVPMVIEDDGMWQGAGVALLDFEDKTGTCTNGTEETRHIVVGSAPADTYDGIRFTLGVPQELNHLDVSTAEPPLNISGLYWSWQGGYKYLRLDGETEDPSFRVHLGATECEIVGPGDFTCARENLAEILLTAFNPEANEIVLDLA